MNFVGTTNLIAEFDIITPVLKETREAVSGLVVEVEDLQLRSGRLPILVCWVECDDFETIDEHLSTDPTIEWFEILATSSDRRLYRLMLSEEGESSLVYPVAVEHGITFLEVKSTDDSTHISARIPDRNVLFSFRKLLEDRGVSFRLKRIYRANDTGNTAYGVTERQREILLYAVENGFFEVPREITLEEIAAEFDISNQAASTLCRRGLANLLDHTLASTADT